MKTHELLELASLDALGLLDDHEREAFDRAFAAAAPAVQAQIRREQARISRAEQYLPEVEAPVSLRAKVLAAVQQAMEAVTGARRTAAASLPTLLPSRGVSPAWRGAAIACAAASLVLAFAGLRIYSDVKIMDRLQQSNATIDAFAQISPRFQREFMNPETRFVSFAPVAKDASMRCSARLMVNPTTRTGYLYCADLPKVPGQYTLVVIDKNGQVGRAVVTFEAGAPMSEHVIPGFDLEDGGNLAILAPGADAKGAAPLLKTGNSL